MKNILFLYTELAEYFLACIAALEKENVRITVVHWPVNAEAPFAFRRLMHARLIEKPAAGDLEKLVADFQPDIIFTSGWVDKNYTEICRKYRPSIPVVLLLDNQWEATLRQQVATRLARRFIHSRFTHAWVPGKPQAEFASRLGFESHHIHTGFYVADLPVFLGVSATTSKGRESGYLHRLLYTGRYVEWKGISLLWDVFASLHQQYPAWELWCVGTGAMWETRRQHPAIRHFGFVQPSALPEIISQCGAFILPSTREPWGVVVQEMAASGLPLLCTDRVGAAHAFLRENENGWKFKASDRQSLTNALTQLFETSDESLIAMGEKSREISQIINHDTWVKTALQLSGVHNA